MFNEGEQFAIGNMEHVSRTLSNMLKFIESTGGVEDALEFSKGFLDALESYCADMDVALYG